MPYDDSKLPEEMEEDGETIVEGAKRTITVNSYERDPRAKKKCKEYITEDVRPGREAEKWLNVFLKRIA